jgi:hypothetical protein
MTGASALSDVVNRRQAEAIFKILHQARKD